MLLEASRARLSLHDPALCDTDTTARQHFMHAQIAYEVCTQHAPLARALPVLALLVAAQLTDGSVAPSENLCSVALEDWA